MVNSKSKALTSHIREDVTNARLTQKYLIKGIESHGSLASGCKTLTSVVREDATKSESMLETYIFVFTNMGIIPLWYKIDVCCLPNPPLKVNL